MSDSFVLRADGYPHIDKDPNATLNYTWDWKDWLVSAGGPTIVTAVVTADAGVTVSGAASIAAGLVTQILTGGTAGISYIATCRITTSDALVDDRSIVLDVLAR